MLYNVELGRGTFHVAWHARCARLWRHDRPACVNCGDQTFLTRRSPAAAYALQLERQTFTCLECDLDFERVVDAQGKPVARLSVAELTARSALIGLHLVDAQSTWARHRSSNRPLRPSGKIVGVGNVGGPASLACIYGAASIPALILTDNGS
jgi:hypothetical protein